MDKPVTFEDFISFFPEITPPFTITETSIDHAKETNKYLPEILIQEFIAKWEVNVDETITEYFPCLSLPSTEHYNAFIYWKASLMKYEYVLITLDKSNNLISRKVISGVFADNETIKKSAARIDEDLIIHIMVGASFPADMEDADNYNPTNSQSIVMEILDRGEIVIT